MITITLQKIKDQHPCADGWQKILEARGGTEANFSAEFPLADALESNSLDDVLWALRCLPEHSRIWRKYAVWCARQVEHLMTDQRSKDALNVAERHADGLATDQELDAAGDAARAAAWAAAWDAAWAAWAARAAAGDAWAAGAARDAQKAKLREVLTAGRWV